jgi:hypothetical protein
VLKVHFQPYSRLVSSLQAACLRAIGLCVGLYSGGDCLPQSSVTLDKPVIRKIIAEDAANPTPGSVGLSISRSDSAVAESTSANEGQKVRRLAKRANPALIELSATLGKETHVRELRR